LETHLAWNEIAPEIRGANYLELGEVAMGPRYNYAYQMLYVFQGEGNAEICGKLHKLSPGFFALYGPGDRHEFRTGGSGPMTLGMMNFSWRKEKKRRLAMGNRAVSSLHKGFERLADPRYRIGWLPPIPFAVSIPEGRRGSLERPLKAAGGAFRKSNDPSMALMYKAALLEIVHALADLFSEGGGKGLSQTARKAAEFVRENYSLQISRSDAAKAAGVSESHLTALLRKELKSNFTELLTKARIDAACELLQFSGMSVKEIAARCGFQDCSYFVALFKKLHGRPPGEWRSA